MKLCNENDFKNPDELKNMEDAVERSLLTALTAMGFGAPTDPHTADTAGRIARAWVRERFSGCWAPAPKIVSFPNSLGMDNLMSIGPIRLNSTCAHHFVDFVGRCWIGILPGERLVGLSKFSDIVNWFARRPQIQEDLTAQIAEFIDTELKPRGVAVVIEARHFCCAARGVKEPDMKFVTAEIRGAFRKYEGLKSEFYTHIAQSKDA